MHQQSWKFFWIINVRTFSFQRFATKNCQAQPKLQSNWTRMLFSLRFRNPFSHWSWLTSLTVQSRELVLDHALLLGGFLATHLPFNKLSQITAWAELGTAQPPLVLLFSAFSFFLFVTFVFLWFRPFKFPQKVLYVLVGVGYLYFLSF